MDLSIFTYQFMQNALISAFLGGIACSIIGVYVVLLHMPFIGVCMAHAAFAGALIGLFTGIYPLISAFILSLLVAAVIGPLADRGELNPDTSIGVIFSLMMGIAFIFLGLMSSSRSGALELLWGSILTVTSSDLILLAVVTAIVVLVVFLFFKEIQATIFNRNLALSVGIPSTLILYGILFLTGITITATLRSIGGLLIFSLILNPAAAAYQLTYSMKRMFIISAIFGILSGWVGLIFSYVFNLPSGATIVKTPVRPTAGSATKAMERKAPRTKALPQAPRRRFAPNVRTPTVPDGGELVEDYGQQIRKARQALQLSQEEFSRKIAEKVSVLQKIEAGRLVPSDSLVHKLEHALKIHLVQKTLETSSTEKKFSRPLELTLGDVAVMQKKSSEK